MLLWNGSSKLLSISNFYCDKVKVTFLLQFALFTFSSSSGISSSANLLPMSALPPLWTIGHDDSEVVDGDTDDDGDDDPYHHHHHHECNEHATDDHLQVAARRAAAVEESIWVPSSPGEEVIFAIIIIIDIKPPPPPPHHQQHRDHRRGELLNVIGSRSWKLTENCVHELFLAGVGHFVETLLARSLLTKPAEDY